MNHHRGGRGGGGGGAAAGAGAGLRRCPTGLTRKPVAKCPANQEAVDKLFEVAEKAAANPNSNYVFIVKKALKSVADCKSPITTHKEATALKYVGSKMATIILPTPSYSSSPTATTTTTTTTTKSVTTTKPSKRNGTENSTTRKSSTTTTTSTTNLSMVAPMPLPRNRLHQSTLSSSLSASSLIANTKQKGKHPDDAPPTKTEVGISAKQKAYDQAQQDAENLIMPTNALWKVILLVDGREHKSKHVVAKCQQSGIPCEERHLPIGDAAWVAQCTIPTSSTSSTNKDGKKTTTSSTVIEVMCGTIIERKEISDFASSLFGTRYNEQRLRLQNSGLPQVMFLVEGELTASVNCPAETLHMAMMETRVQLGFQVVQTKHLQDTVRLLKGLHRRIVQRTFPDAFSSLQNDDPLPTYRSPNEGGILRKGSRGPRRQRRPTSLLEMVFDTPPVPPLGSSRFITYSELKAKIARDREAGTRTVGAVYMAMLKQVPTLSQKKCHAIARDYPTLNALMTAYASCSNNHDQDGDSGDDDPALLVRDVVCERQKVGPKSSQELFVACCTDRRGNLPRSGGPTTKNKTKKNNNHITVQSKTVLNKSNLKDPPNSPSPERMIPASVTEWSPESSPSTSSSSATVRRITALQTPPPRAQSSFSSSSNCVDLTTPVSVPATQASRKPTERPVFHDVAAGLKQRQAPRSLQPPYSTAASLSSTSSSDKWTTPSKTSQRPGEGRVGACAMPKEDSSPESSHDSGSPPLFESPSSSCSLSSPLLDRNSNPVKAKMPVARTSLNDSFVAAAADVLDLSQHDDDEEEGGKDGVASLGQPLRNGASSHKSQNVASPSILVIDSSDEDDNMGAMIRNESSRNSARQQKLQEPPPPRPPMESSYGISTTTAPEPPGRLVSTQSSTGSGSDWNIRTNAVASSRPSKRSILEEGNASSSSSDDNSLLGDRTSSYRHTSTKRPRVALPAPEEVEVIEID